MTEQVKTWLHINGSVYCLVPLADMKQVIDVMSARRFISSEEDCDNDDEVVEALNKVEHFGEYKK